MDIKKARSRIYAELRQQHVFDHPERELAVVLLRTGDVLHHSIGRSLAPWELSNEQYNALRILRGAGEKGHPTLEVLRRLISRSPNITRLLDKLIEKDLVRRDRDAADRRQAVVRITPKGEQLLKECDKAVDAVIAKLGCLTSAELKVAVGLLDRVREAVEVTTVREELLGETPKEYERRS